MRAAGLRIMVRFSLNRSLFVECDFRHVPVERGSLAFVALSVDAPFRCALLPRFFVASSSLEWIVVPPTPTSLKSAARLGAPLLSVKRLSRRRTLVQPLEQQSHPHAGRAARDFLARREGVRMTEIVLMGRSLGGGVMVDLAARDGARALILESSCVSPRYFQVRGFRGSRLVPALLHRRV